MPAGRTPYDRIRRAVKLRIEATSLRQTVREIKVSPTGLRNFLEGAEPYPGTRRKLQSWYVRRADGHVSAEAALQALLVLVQDLPPVKRSEALERLVGALEESFEALGEAAPDWVPKLRAMVSQGR